DLGTALDWKRARLSRQVTRMAERGLVRREPGSGREQIVVATDAGSAALAAARPAHAQAVRQALLAPGAAVDAGFWDVVRAITAGAAEG
ncbi:MAG TPA: MarR family transcriptional regulator, partial [Umezawaea sp.]|nr:MarR family transcriptional regulator [Umezawaea sp.]